MGDNQDVWPAGMTATMNVTYTQANAAGGAIVCEITPGAGNEFIPIAVRIVNSGTNSVLSIMETAVASNVGPIIANVGSGAGTSANLTIGTAGQISTTNNGAAGLAWPLIFSGPTTWKIYQGGAGAQNDTFQVIAWIRVKTGQMPTVTHANSTNAANVSVTAGAESFTTG